MLRKQLLLLSFLFATVCVVPAQETRHFAFQYSFTVKDVPAGERLRVWVPAPHSDEFQEVKVISGRGDLGFRKTRESRFGNEMYYAQTSEARQADVRFEFVYDVVRHQRLTLGVARPHLDTGTCSTPAKPKRATAPTFIPCLSQCPVRKAFRRALK